MSHFRRSRSISGTRSRTLSPLTSADSSRSPSRRRSHIAVPSAVPRNPLGGDCDAGSSGRNGTDVVGAGEFKLKAVKYKHPLKHEALLEGCGYCLFIASTWDAPVAHPSIGVDRNGHFWFTPGMSHFKMDANDLLASLYKRKTEADRRVRECSEKAARLVRRRSTLAQLKQRCAKKEQETIEALDKSDSNESLVNELVSLNHRLTRCAFQVEKLEAELRTTPSPLQKAESEVRWCLNQARACGPSWVKIDKVFEKGCIAIVWEDHMVLIAVVPASSPGSTAGAIDAYAGVPRQRILRMDEIILPRMNLEVKVGARKYSVGEHVRAYWGSHGNQLYNARIHTLNADGTYHLRFEDGAEIHQAPKNYIKTEPGPAYLEPQCFESYAKHIARVRSLLQWDLKKVLEVEKKNGEDILEQPRSEALALAADRDGKANEVGGNDEKVPVDETKEDSGARPKEGATVDTSESTTSKKVSRESFSMRELVLEKLAIRKHREAVEWKLDNLEREARQPVSLGSSLDITFHRLTGALMVGGGIYIKNQQFGIMMFDGNALSTSRSTSPSPLLTPTDSRAILVGSLLSAEAREWIAVFGRLRRRVLSQPEHERKQHVNAGAAV